MRNDATTQVQFLDSGSPSPRRQWPEAEDGSCRWSLRCFLWTSVNGSGPVLPLASAPLVHPAAGPVVATCVQVGRTQSVRLLFLFSFNNSEEH
jgi:hypothetical protein